jgi:hypothetical protein
MHCIKIVKIKETFNFNKLLNVEKKKKVQGETNKVDRAKRTHTADRQ